MAFSISSDKKKEKIKQFPKLMKSTETGRIVLFYRSECGIALNDEGLFGAGEHCQRWKMDSFVDHNEPVTIQND